MENLVLLAFLEAMAIKVTKVHLDLKEVKVYKEQEANLDVQVNLENLDRQVRLEKMVILEKKEVQDLLDYLVPLVFLVLVDHLVLQAVQAKLVQKALRAFLENTVTKENLVSKVNLDLLDLEDHLDLMDQKEKEDNEALEVLLGQAGHQEKGVHRELKVCLGQMELWAPKVLLETEVVLDHKV